MTEYFSSEREEIRSVAFWVFVGGLVSNGRSRGRRQEPLSFSPDAQTLDLGVNFLIKRGREDEMERLV